jgi:hypothetical protein
MGVNKEHLCLHSEQYDCLSLIVHQESAMNLMHRRLNPCSSLSLKVQWFADQVHTYPTGDVTSPDAGSASDDKMMATESKLSYRTK